MVLKQCSIKYSLLFYFTGFLVEAGDAWGCHCPLPVPALVWGWLQWCSAGPRGTAALGKRLKQVSPPGSPNFGGACVHCLGQGPQGEAEVYCPP